MTRTTDRPEIDRADVERMVDAVAPRWSVERVRPTDEGSDYVAFLTVSTPTGAREVVLKAFTSDVVPPDVGRSEPRILRLLAAETAIPVPDVIGFVDEHPELPAPFFIAERLPGENGTDLFEELSPAAIDRLLADAGRYLAELHSVRSFDRFGRIGVADGDLAVVEGEFGAKRRWADWLLADVEDTLDGLAGSRFADLVGAIRRRVREEISEIDGPDEAVLVHWDYRLGNLLVDPDTGRTTGVLDWVGPLAGDPLYNLVAVEDQNVNWQTEDVVRRRRLRDRLFAAYDADHPGARQDDFHDRKRLYHLCHRLNAMACLPDWYADAAEPVREERAVLHRAFVREYLE